MQSWQMVSALEDRRTERIARVACAPSISRRTAPARRFDWTIRQLFVREPPPRGRPGRRAQAGSRGPSDPEDDRPNAYDAVSSL